MGIRPRRKAMSDFALATAPGTYVNKGAIISACGTYRYRLWREWRGVAGDNHWRWFDAVDGAGHQLGEPMSMVFIMLNPSTADGEYDDATIRRCVSFAKREGYDRMEVLNLFAYRTKSPKELMNLHGSVNPEGPDNQDYFDQVVFESGNRIVCAWGAHGHHLGQHETVKGWLPNKKWWCFGRTAKGFPKHPLYLPQDAQLEIYS